MPSSQDDNHSGPYIEDIGRQIEVGHSSKGTVTRGSGKGQ